MNKTIRIRFQPFRYNSVLLHYQTIRAFDLAHRAKNDANNRLRETIIGAIINKQVPSTYYLLGSRWQAMKAAVYTYLKKLDINDTDHIKCIHRGGRNKNFDFDLEITSSLDGTLKTLPIELKFNAATIKKAPQYASPMKPSQYLSASYEAFYYDNYLPHMAALAHLPLPPKADYLKQIHGNQPDCMRPYQKLYYQGCSTSSQYTNDPAAIEFYKSSNSWGKESIKKFLETTQLDIAALSTYLLTSQQGKIYMLYTEGTFHLERAPMDDYVIESVIRHTHNRYECMSKSGIKMNVLLRWKNGNGIAFPAFQIS